MRAGLLTVALNVGALIACAPAALATSPCGTNGVFSQTATTAICTYTSAGTEDTFTVPASVARASVTAIGAPGGAGNNAGPGLGATVTNMALPVTPGAEMWVDVGHAGNQFNCAFDPGGAFDGGTAGFCSGSGGGSSALLTAARASATLTGNAATDSRVLVAGGGGGGGQSGVSGGSAGDPNVTGAGAGGCATPGGSGGVGPTDGTAGGGAAGCGPNAAVGTASGGGQGSNSGAGGGGGGGGWFGGGGGGVAGGGGAGSSYGGAGSSAGISIATAGPTDAPEVVITYSTLPAPTASITTPANNATYAQGQVVASNFSCTDGAGGPGIKSCVDQNGNPSGTPIDTSTLGQHTFTVTALSNDGTTSESSVTYTVALAPSVSITTPANGAIYTLNQVVHSSFSCTESAGGPGIASCVDQNGRPSGAAVDTSKPGKHTFKVTATSKDGLTQTATVTYRVKPPKIKPRVPRLSHLRLKPRSFEAATKGGALVARVEIGTTITYRDTLAARTTFRVYRGGVLLGSFRHHDHAGTNRLRFTGRVNDRSLRPGHYVLTAIAVFAGQKSKVLRATFTILAPPPVCHDPDADGDCDMPDAPS
jgi:hypothetical protein